MVEAMKRSLRDSAAARWSALAIVSVIMFCGYYFDKATSAFKTAIVDSGWSSVDFGFFKSAYGWLNVFAFMLIIGGIILDKKGVRFTGILAALVMVFGVAVCWVALASGFPLRTQVWMAAVGFAFFGTGVEVAGITVSKVIVKWFKGKELATAMGLQLAVARMGTAVGLAVAMPLALQWGVKAVPFLGLALLVMGTIAFIFYCRMDKKLDASEPQAKIAHEDAFKLADIVAILKNKGFWLIALLCLIFYSGVFPFLDYATDLMVQKYHVDAKLAGLIPALLPFGNILLTPLFGTIYDRKGKGASIMILGAFLLVFVHVIFAIPAFSHWAVAVGAMLLLGVAFSLVPSAMWPSVPKLIPEKQLGTAYSMIFYIQNIGLMGVPYLVGWVLDRFCRLPDVDGKVAYNYTLPLLIFLSFGVIAVFVAFLLKADDRKKGYGLELPNIKRA
ncbi:MAG: MFS transporter [Candidatus Aminicenantes bacterium]|nr:MFS transporter [Candidatus Aminicenantes bacterium]